MVGNLVAEALNLRVVAVDANRDFGTLASLAPDPLRVAAIARGPPASPRPHRLGVRRPGRRLQLPSGLDVPAAPEQAEVMAAMTPESYGDLLDLLGRFDEVVLLDLGTGIVDRWPSSEDVAPTRPCS